MHRFDQPMSAESASCNRFQAFAASLAGVALALAAGSACAGVPWHSDVAQAKAASVISHRPVLVVFTATWSEASMALDKTTLANDEAVALVTACFEPVKIDVDADPETTRRMGVSYLPTACVIDLDDRVLATFDCPDTPASFIAAAGRAAQDAAAAKAGPQQPSDGTVAAVMAQARGQSAFTAEKPAPQPSPTTVASQPVTEPADDSLPAAPPTTWPAEQAPRGPLAMAPASAAAATSAVAAPAPQRPNIEPAPSTQQRPTPTGMASWLGDTAAVPPAAPSPTAPASGAAAAPAAPAAPAVPAAPEAAATPVDPPKPTNPFIAALQKPLAFLPKWPGTKSSESAAAPAAAASQTAASTAATDPHGSMPLGLEGYCPVTLLERGQWVEGRAQYGARHRGRTYLFAGPQQQQTFLADPDRYAPALSGDDPVMAFDAGKSIPGQRRFGVTYQSRVYLFSSPDTRTAFSADPQKYTSRVATAEKPSANSTVTR